MKGDVISVLLFFIAAFASSVYAQSPAGNGNTFLLNMSPAEAMAVVDCVAESRDGAICNRYSQCLTLLPRSIQRVYSECRRTFIGGSWITCTTKGASLPPAFTREQVFRCIDENARQETRRDTEAVNRMEICMRRLYATRCRTGYKAYQPPRPLRTMTRYQY